MCPGGATMASLLTYCFLSQVILYQGGQMFDGAPRFHGRVGFTGTMPATNVSIFINNTQLSDTGTYQCLVNNLPDRGGRNIGVAGLTVLGEWQASQITVGFTYKSTWNHVYFHTSHFLPCSLPMIWVLPPSPRTSHPQCPWTSRCFFYLMLFLTVDEGWHKSQF